jgi:hypothetical protein
MEAIIILIFVFFTYYKNCECILEKKHKPPSFKLNGCSLNCFIFSDYGSLRDVRKKTTEWLILIKKKYEINSLWLFSKKNILIPNAAEKNILILVEEGKK